ncbi:MAG: hypothetical protein JSU05_07310 [Bacteroidetes bacterium]|nr:hypothetical protein [Bacteroidota bacterium]
MKSKNALQEILLKTTFKIKLMNRITTAFNQKTLACALAGQTAGGIRVVLEFSFASFLCFKTKKRKGMYAIAKKEKR